MDTTEMLSKMLTIHGDGFQLSDIPDTVFTLMEWAESSFTGGKAKEDAVVEVVDALLDSSALPVWTKQLSRPLIRAGISLTKGERKINNG